MLLGKGGVFSNEVIKCLTHTGASDVIRSHSAEVDRGDALDEDANAYYYYDSTGHTQWEDLVQTEEHLLQKRR